MDPFAAVVAIAQEELDLVTSGRFDALPELHDRRDRAMAALPAVTPPAAGPALRHAVELQRQISETLTIAAAGTRQELHVIDTGRATVAGYRQSTGTQAPIVQADYRG